MKCQTPLCEAMVVLSLYKKTQIGYTQYVDNDVYLDDVVDDDEAGAGAYFLHCEGMDSQTNIKQGGQTNGWIIRRLQCRRQHSTSCRMLQEPVSRTMLSTEYLNAEPFTRGPQCQPSSQSSNVLLDEVLTKDCGPPWTE